MPDKSELERIRYAYANMEDEALLNIAKNEGLKLYADAFVLLKEEMNRRNVGAYELQQLEHEIILRASLNKQRLEEDLNKSLFEQAIEFALSEKIKGSSNYDIYAGLIEMGVSDESSNFIVNKIEDWADRLHKNSKSDIRAAVGILILGIIAIKVAMSIGHFELAALTLVLGGIVKIIVGAYKSIRYQKILDMIKDEEAPTGESDNRKL